MKEILYKLNLIKCLTFLTIGVFGTLVSNAQTYLTFEDATPPSGWINTGIKPLSTDAAHYKLGRKSLKWQWNAKDTLKVDNPDTLLSVSSKSSNSIGFYTWVYNENPMQDSLKFLITDATKTVNLSFKMYLNFKGWRNVYVDLKGDLKYSYNASKPLRYLNVIAPSTGNGNLYFDLFEIQNGSLWNKANDFFVNVDPAPPYDYVSPRKLNPDTTIVNLSDTIETNLIEKKLESWIVDNSAVAGDSRGYLNSRIAGIQNWIREATTKRYSPIYRLKFERQADNSVNAYDSISGEGMGLFSSSFSYSQTISNYTTSVLLQLALNYKLNKVQSDLQRCIDILDWMYDQGMADSSVMGSLYLQGVRLTALPQAFFVLRNDLPAKTYTNTLNSIRWLTMFGTTYGKKYASMESKNADDIRSGGVGKLIYALSIKNQKERIVSVDSLQSFFNFAFSPSPGNTGIFKYDYSTYHHGGPYTSEYGDDALHQSSLIYYFLDNTKFSLDNTVYDLLRNSWLRYDLFSTNYGAPAGTGGRFPLNTSNVLEHTQAIAALALTNKGLIDDSLKGTFKRLMNIDTALLRTNVLAKSSSSIQYTASLGAAKDLINALKLSSSPSPDPVDVQYMPYSGLFIHRNKGWLTTIKGFSKYIWDYEYLPGTVDNYLGRYLSYGNMEISSTLNKKYRLVDECFDWSHIAGTTAKYLPMSLIKSQDSALGGSYWRFSDQTFLGGVRLNDSIGTFSMYLHNTTKIFDSSFRAKKSSFFFGDVIYCMGSSISSTDNANQTHTTLYQTLLPKNASPLVYINGVVDTLSHNYTSATNNVSIKDSWGNAYIVYGGNDSLYIKREVRDNEVNNSNDSILKYRTLDVAYLSHGAAPNNNKYNYSVLLQPSQQLIDTMMKTVNPVFQVLKQDDSAHIVYNVPKGIFGYSLFTMTAEINYPSSIIKKVYSPSILMESINDSISRTIAFTDPDLRRRLGAGDTLFGQSKIDSMDVRGKYIIVNGDVNNVSVKYLGSNESRLYINASEGNTYKVKLQLIDTFKIGLPFTNGNIAVLRLSKVSAGGNQVFIDEYDTLGKLKQSMAIDSFYQPTANTSAEEGYLTLSGDGQFIGLTGYSRTTTANSGLYGSRFDTINRVVAFIKYDGSFKRNNVIPSLDITKPFYPKSVFTKDGSDFWLGYGNLSSNYGGIMYGKTGANNNVLSLKSVTAWKTGYSVRQLNYNPTDKLLYFGTGNSKLNYFNSTSIPIDSINPISVPNQIQITARSGAKGFCFVQNDTMQLLYVAISSNAGSGIIKYKKDLLLNSWDSVGAYGLATDSYFSITAKANGGTIKMYAIRKSVNTNSKSEIVNITDTWDGDMSQSSEKILIAANSALSQVFRGISIVPVVSNGFPLNIKTKVDSVIAIRNEVKGLQISPNPSNGYINIAYPMINNRNATLKIFNVNGVLMYQQTIENRSVGKKVDVSKFSNGVYVLKVESQKQVLTGKFIKQ